MERYERGIDSSITQREFFHQLEHKNKVVIRSKTEPSLTHPCFNCGNLHSAGDCDKPTYFVRCPRCWIVSFDRSGHRLPCTETNTTSRFCDNIFGRMALPLFTLRVRKCEADMYLMDPNTAKFEMANGKSLLSPATCGAFQYAGLGNRHMISYSTNTYSRISFLIAIHGGKQWAVRFRGILSPVHGLLMFKVKNLVGDRDIFASLQDNTVAVIGLKPRFNAMEIQFEVFAKDRHHGNEYYGGAVDWRCRDGFFDQTSIDDVLDGNTPKAEKLYDRSLYHNFQDLSLAQQHFN